jgi:hypothetical protein
MSGKRVYQAGTTTKEITDCLDFAAYPQHSIPIVRFMTPKLRALLFFAAIFALCHETNAQENKDAKEAAPRTENLLSVQAEIIAQSYCHVDDQTFSVFMDLKLHFTNLSDHAVILSRRIESPAVVRAARDAQAGANGNFLYSPDPHFMVSEMPDSPSFGDKPNSKLFIILAPTESFETVVHSGVLGGKRDLATRGSGLLSRGKYVLQVGLSTWPYQWPYFTTETDSQSLKERWARYGELSTGLLYSDFVPFTLPEHFKNPGCR